MALLTLFVPMTIGCGEPEARATARATATVVDSAVPIDVALERFRANLPVPETLAGGMNSRETLVRAFVTAVESSDTAALRRMVLSKAEFAWLYYPSSQLARPPYELPPGLLWFQMEGQTEKGASLLLSDRVGKPLQYVDHSCNTERTEGANRVHGHCVVRRLAAPGDTITDRLFGLILERGGVFKFVSYANKLD